MRTGGVFTIGLVLSLFTALDLYAQTATVMGQIRHEGRNPAVNVIVSIGEKFSVTDGQGRYLIKDVPFGRHTLRIKENREAGRVLKEVTLEITQSRVKHNEVIGSR